MCGRRVASCARLRCPVVLASGAVRVESAVSNMAMPGAVSAITQMAMPASKGGLSPAREGLRRNPRPAARPEHDFAGAQAGAPRQETTGSIMVHATTESPSKSKGSGNLRPGHSPGAEDCGGGREDGARGAANSGGTAPDTTKWNWVPCENRPELLTYHDGKKRWFHCSKCEYWNDRLYHTKMHYERIHVKQGYVPDARALFHL